MLRSVVLLTLVGNSHGEGGGLVITRLVGHDE